MTPPCLIAHRPRFDMLTRICILRAAGESVPTFAEADMESAEADSRTPATTDETQQYDSGVTESVATREGAQAPAEVRRPRKRGVDAPPFQVQNQGVVAFLIAIVAMHPGTLIPMVHLSEAVALQIRELVFSGAVPELKGWACVCILLASLKVGRRVGPVSAALLDRLRHAFDRRASQRQLRRRPASALCLCKRCQI